MSGDNDILVRISGELDSSVQDAAQGAANAFRKTTEEWEAQTAAFHAANDALRAAGSSMREESNLYEETVASLTKSVDENIIKLQARREVLRSPETAAAIREEAALRVEMDNLSKKILEETAGTRENISAIKAKEAAETAARASAQAWNAQVAGVTESLANQNRALLAQQQAMKSPEYQEHLAANKRLKEEIAAMTGATAKNTAETKAADAVESGIFSNMRTRREALVMVHEAMMGRTKNLMGSAMVFAEYADLDIMKTVTSMINPVTVGVGLAAVAVVGLGVELVKLSAEAAESYHKMELMGEQSGSTAQDIIALQHAAIGTEIPTKALADAFGKFTLRLGEHRAELAAVGITARDPKEAFAQLMDVAAETSDVTERNRILNVALGRSWEQLMPLLSQGGDAFRTALKEMQIPDSTKKRYEEINALQEENAKNWDTIKQHAAGAAAGVLEDIDKIKLGFTELAKQRGLLSEIGNVAAKTAGGALAGTMVAPGVGTVVGGAVGLGAAVYGLYSEGDDAAKRMAAKPKPGGGAGAQGPSEELLKARAEWEKTFRKDSLADALKDEEKRWKDERAIQGAGHADLEAADRAHRMRMADIRKSFERKTPKGRSDDGARTSLYDLVGRDEREAQSASVAANAEGSGSLSASIMAKKAAELARYQNARAELLKARDKLQVETAADAAQVDAGLAALSVQHQANLTKIEADGTKQREALQKKSDADYLKEVRERAKKAEDIKLKAMQEAFQREQVEFEADLAKKKAYFEAINNGVQNLSGKFGSLGSSITSLALKSDLTFHKIIEAVKEMAISIAADIVGMVTKILAEVALLEVADVVTGGLVSAVLGATSETPSILGYATGGLLGGDAAGPATSTVLSFDVGTPNVPRDMMARIHKGEAIVPASFAESIRSGQMTLGGPAGSSSSSSSTYHDNRSWTIPTTISRAELAPMLDRTKASAIRGGFNKVSH